MSGFKTKDVTDKARQLYDLYCKPQKFANAQDDIRKEWRNLARLVLQDEADELAADAGTNEKDSA